MFVLIFLVIQFTVFAQTLKITRTNVGLTGLTLGKTYNLLVSSNVSGAWTTNQSFVAVGISTQFNISMNKVREFWKSEKLVPPTITLVSDPYVERLLTIVCSLPITNGMWKIIVRTNGTIFLSWNGTITNDQIRVQDSNPTRYGYPGLTNGFQAEVSVSNAMLRLTNTFLLANYYRPPPSGYEGAVIEQVGVITGTDTNRLNADIAFTQLLGGMTDYWKFYNISNRNTSINPTNWNVLDSPTLLTNLQAYLDRTTTNRPSHLFYLGTNAGFAITNKLTLAVFIGFNAQVLATASAGPPKTSQQLFDEGKYARFALWIDTPVAGIDLSERLSDALAKFSQLGSELDFFTGYRKYWLAEVIAQVQSEFPEFILGVKGCSDYVDWDGFTDR